jgi:hypothetical protein
MVNCDENVSVEFQISYDNVTGGSGMQGFSEEKEKKKGLRARLMRHRVDEIVQAAAISRSVDRLSEWCHTFFENCLPELPRSAQNE